MTRDSTLRLRAMVIGCARMKREADKLGLVAAHSLFSSFVAGVEQIHGCRAEWNAMGVTPCGCVFYEFRPSEPEPRYEHGITKIGRAISQIRAGRQMAALKTTTHEVHQTRPA